MPSVDRQRQGDGGNALKILDWTQMRETVIFPLAAAASSTLCAAPHLNHPTGAPQILSSLMSRVQATRPNGSGVPPIRPDNLRIHPQKKNAANMTQVLIKPAIEGFWIHIEAKRGL